MKEYRAQHDAALVEEYGVAIRVAPEVVERQCTTEPFAVRIGSDEWQAAVRAMTAARMSASRFTTAA